MNILLFNQQYLWLFFIPFTLLVPVNLLYVRQLMQWCWIYVLSSLAFSLYCFNDFFFNAQDLFASMIGWDAYVVNRPQEPSQLLYPVTAFLIFYSHYPKLRQLVFILSTILAVGSGMMAGRRSATAILVALVLVQVILSLLQSKKRVVIVTFFVILGFISIPCITPNKAEILFENIFPVLSNRIDSDSRSGTEEDFYKDMTENTDWFFGRGMNGTYRSPAVADLDRLDRVVIETGYLNIILHGGLLMLIPYIVLLLYASYKGFYCSNSIFLKSCALYIFMHILMLYPDGTPKLTLDYFILFVFTRICISQDFRMLKDEDILLHIK